ncbi:hypothetical protein [Hoeflea sp. AS16]|uniref:hypothetical protein n=1 Tax=Hoeflea sp. AS16 TaxID=3135779 RepID=UPI00319EBC62
MSRIRITAMIVTLALCGCVAQSPQNAGGRKTSVNLDAVLPPQSLLRDDTLAALSHDRSQSRLGYVGVWATDGDKCAMMDQTAFEGFAVITPNSLRRSAETCTFEPGEPGSNVARLDATCKARGRKTTKRTISLQMLSSRSLYLRTAPDRPGVAMVRCRLLQ